MKKFKGFTLIELMIMTTIVGVLAAIAIPAYIDYTIRAKVSEGLSLTSSAKTAIAEYYFSKSVFLTGVNNNEGYGLPQPISIRGNHVSAMMVLAEGQITVLFQNNLGGDANNKTIQLLPVTETTGSLKWKCREAPFSTMPAKYVPANCR